MIDRCIILDGRFILCYHYGEHKRHEQSEALFLCKFAIDLDFERRAADVSWLLFCWAGDSMARDAHYDMARHKAWRAKVIRRAGGLCEECKRYGRIGRDGLPIPATTAHHIKHRDEYPELAFDVNNGRALCAKCHNREHPEKGGYWR